MAPTPLDGPRWTGPVDRPHAAQGMPPDSASGDGWGRYDLPNVTWPKQMVPFPFSSTPTGTFPSWRSHPANRRVKIPMPARAELLVDWRAGYGDIRYRYTTPQSSAPPYAVIP